MAKFITNILKEKINLQSIFSIKNTYNLVDNLYDMKINDNTKLFSFDIDNMYTNIPITDTIDIIFNKLKINNEDEFFIKQLINILTIILNQNYFTYNNNIYQQNQGLAMGAPTSSIISEIFLHELDKQIYNIIKNNDPSGKYFRYVDDTLYISQNNGKNIHKIFDEINNLHKNIKFKIEEEINNKLNFLDITIHNNHNNFKFSIYRKPTQNNLIIPNSSMHPPQHKMAAFNSMLYRMHRLPLSQIEKQKEKTIVFRIALDNGYKLKTIEKLNYKIQQKINNRMTKLELFNEQDNNYLYSSFTYIGFINQKISNLFKNTNVKITYTSNQTNFNRIKPKAKNIIYNLNGVYKIECPSCNKFYVGQTGKSLQTRFSQHKNAYLKPHIYNSNFAHHCIVNNHEFPNINSMYLIKHIPKGIKMNIWEDLFIFKHLEENTIIQEQVQIKSKHDNFFKILKTFICD